MQYNIFKVKDKQNLLNDMVDRGYHKVGQEISSEEYKLNLYCKYDDDQRLNWKNIFVEFGEDNIPKKTGLSSIIICYDSKNVFAITYGSSSFLVQKNSDREFGFDFAKRIGLKEMKRKSSVSHHSNTNSSIVSLRNTRTVLFDTGENITSLSFTPDNDFYGKRIDIGKSIKLSLDLKLVDISDLFSSILSDLEKPIINNIPLLTEIKNQEDIDIYNQIMYDDLQRQFDKYKDGEIISQLHINEFYIVGTSIYFDEENRKVIKIGNHVIDCEINDLNDIFINSKELNIDIQTFIEKAKVVYMDSNNSNMYSEPFKKFINYEIESDKVSLYDNNWYDYNEDYYELIMNELSTLKVVYNPDADIEEQYIKSIPGDEYREQKLNQLLQKKYNGRLLDRNLFISKYEGEYFNKKYRLEIADLILEKSYISIKIGKAASLAYCIDQSELSAKLIYAKKINLQKDKLPVPEKYIVWFYMDNENIFKTKNIDIKKLGSIMLLSKLSDWSKIIKSVGKVPIVYVNKYIK